MIIQGYYIYFFILHHNYINKLIDILFIEIL